MRRIVMGCALAVVALALVGGQPAEAQDLQAKLAAAKQAAAQSQQALRSYTWIEKTELSFKGEVKNTKIESCRYGPDGKVQKSVVEAPPPAEKKRGLRGKIVEKKTEEMKEELEAASALVHQYVPPDPGLIQVVTNAGKASLAQQGPGLVALKFPDYLKAGDALTLTLDSSLKAMRQIGVTLQVQMASLPDASYPGSVTLAIPASQIEVRITNTNYQKLAQ
jgi:hypothetical protein